MSTQQAVMVAGEDEGAPSSPRNFVLLGRAMGTVMDWDMDGLSVILYGFKPAVSAKLPFGNLIIRLDRGTVDILRDDGTVQGTVDIIDALHDAPRS